MAIITIHEHVETISLRSPTTQNMLNSMRNLGQRAHTLLSSPCTDLSSVSRTSAEIYSKNNVELCFVCNYKPVQVNTRI